METYSIVFVYFEQNDWAGFLPIAEFVYNNAKNASTGHMLFELNREYHPRVLYKEEVDFRFQSKLADKLSAKLRELIVICSKNLHHTQELQKRAYNKRVKPRSYALGKRF